MAKNTIHPEHPSHGKAKTDGGDCESEDKIQVSSQPTQVQHQQRGQVIDGQRNGIEINDPTRLYNLKYQHQQHQQHQQQQQRPDFWNNPRPTNENPNFVQDYFASSRLHFIGSFRARYESMMVQVGKRLGINPSILLHDTNANGNVSGRSIIVHVDMDAFFASVAVRDNPQLKGLPVAVCHDAGEISSCTYEARKFGIRAGMFFREGRKLCPSLKSVSYDFNAYEQVSIQIYTLFYQIAKVRVEAVSVDEAYLDITNTVSNNHNNEKDISQQRENVEDLIRSLRSRISEQTGCSASAGIGPSKLIARLATKRAKPNGQHCVLCDEVINYINSLKLADLPGIGYRTLKRLNTELKIETIPQFRGVPLDRLKHLFGDRQGETFYQLVRAIDKRRVETLKPRRSIGAELSWGIRFLTTEEHKVYIFISQVAAQVALRVSTAGAYGTKVTYKVYKRIRGADASHYKHLGHGPCTILSKSVRLPSSRLTGAPLKKALVQACHQLHRQMAIAHEDFRGVGIQVMDLVFADLKLDPLAAAGTSSASTSVVPTKRIDSFFKSAGHSHGGGVSTSSPNKVISKLDSTERIENDLGGKNDEISREPDITSSIVNDGAKTTVADEIVQEAPASVIENDEIEAVQRRGHEVVNDDGIEKVRPLSTPNKRRRTNNSSGANGTINQTDSHQSPGAHDEDHENATSSGEKAKAENAQSKAKARPIPNGWDRTVFDNLPIDIQTELLKQAGIDHDQRPARRPNGQPQQLTLGRMFGRSEQRRPQAAHVVAVNGERERDRAGGQKNRKRGSRGQVTITQLAEVERARRSGNQMVSASEFREHGLRDAVELLEDLKGQSSRMGLGLGLGLSRDSDHNNSVDAERWHNSELTSNDKDNIPSPPSLSSDDDDDANHIDEDDDDGDAPLRRAVHQRSFVRVYADEDVTTYAQQLAAWLQQTNTDVKSAHIELLRSRLLEMMRLGSLQRLCDELRVMRRFVVRGGFAGWINPFNALLGQIQQECRADYNFALNVAAISTTASASI